MQVNRSPHAEELLRDQLAMHAGSSAEEIVERALEMPAEQPPAERSRTPAQAVEHIRESRKGIILGGVKVKDLLHEGRKY